MPDKFRDGWLRTDDAGNVDSQGFVQITDRSKDVIKSGGEWISSLELKDAIMSHDDVGEAAVVGVPHEGWDERPMACVVLKEGTDVGVEDLKTYLEGRVAKWWIPERWTSSKRCPRPASASSTKRSAGPVRRRGAGGDPSLTGYRSPGPGTSAARVLAITR